MQRERIEVDVPICVDAGMMTPRDCVECRLGRPGHVLIRTREEGREKWE